MHTVHLSKVVDLYDIIMISLFMAMNTTKIRFSMLWNTTSAPIFGLMHHIELSSRLCRFLESHRAEKWPGKERGDVHGIVEANDKLMVKGGFTYGKETSGTSDVPKWQSLPPILAEAVTVPSEVQVGVGRFEVTEICCANIDTLSAALALGDACALNFANAEIPGGRYRSGGLAQEEDLCRLLPQLYPALKSFQYPIPPGVTLITRNLEAVRQPGSYTVDISLGQVTILTAAMPYAPDRRPKGGWATSDWAVTVTLRIRSVLHAAKFSGHANVVLGAFGCGAFGNPTRPVAAIFRELLMSLEFRGCFSKVVFAIIDPMGTGNLKPFKEELAQIDQGLVPLGRSPPDVAEGEAKKKTRGIVFGCF